MKLNEKRIRQIVRNVIRESNDDDLDFDMDEPVIPDEIPDVDMNDLDADLDDDETTYWGGEEGYYPEEEEALTLSSLPDRIEGGFGLHSIYESKINRIVNESVKRVLHMKARGGR